MTNDPICVRATFRQRIVSFSGQKRRVEQGFRKPPCPREEMERQAGCPFFGGAQN